jgi:trans-aconitate methyltransferase
MYSAKMKCRCFFFLIVLFLGCSILMNISKEHVNWDNQSTFIENFKGTSLSEYHGDPEKIKLYPDRCDGVYSRLFEVVMNNNAIITYEIEKIKKETKINEDSRVLDAGCGVGYHIQEITKKIPELSIEGVDFSKNFVHRAKIRNPGIEFICTSLTVSQIYKPKSLTHILCLHDTLNHNTSTDVSKILNNFREWLIPEGYLIVHVLDPNRLDPAPRIFSQYYKGKDNVRHSLTYFEAFTHDAWWEKVKGKKYWYKYCEKFIFPQGKLKIKTTEYWIPPKNAMVKFITQHGFHVKQIVELNDVELPDFSLYIFRKNR